MRLTCSSLSLLSAEPTEAVAIIAELGFPAMDIVGIPSVPVPHLDVGRRDPAELVQLERAVKGAGMEVANIVTIPTDGMPRWDLGEITARVAWAVRACQKLDTPRLVLDAGNPIPGDIVERAEGLSRWKSMIDEALVLTTAAGVSLTVEAPHTGTLAERFDQVQELLAVMAHPEVGLDYDTSHVFRSGTSVEESWNLVSSRVVKVALRDVDHAGEFCRPGTGLVDFPTLFRLLKAQAFPGDMVVELETPGIESVPDQKREIELAREYLEIKLAG